MGNQSYITLCTLYLVYVLYNYNYIHKCNGFIDLLLYILFLIMFYMF